MWLLQVIIFPEAVSAQYYASKSIDTGGNLTFGSMRESNLKKLNRVISVHLKDVTVEQALKVITSKAELLLSYGRNEQMRNNRVSLNLENVTVLEALYKVVDGLNLQFQLSSSGYLIVVPGKLQSPSLNEPIGEPVRYELAEFQVSGQVVSKEDGDPLPGVNIVVKGTTVGTTTDERGRYTLAAPNATDTLIFSFIGYETIEIAILGRSTIDVVMSVSSVLLGDEIVVVGYGAQRRSDITGTVASVPEERLELLTNRTLSQVIQGAVPGVMVRTSTAGAAPSEAILIRGRNSITASNDPLIVVDGVPYGGALRDINVNDIQSLEILKDASAAAIYGARGSNGVILVTTKRGSDGSPRISYDGNYSIQSYLNLPDMMNGEEFYNFKLIRYPEVITQSEKEIYESGEWTDWVDLAIRDGHSQQHDLSVSGGFGGTSYFLSGSFLDVQGLTLNDDYLRATGRINVDTKIGSWLTIGTRTQYSYDDRSGMTPELSGGHGVYRMNPLTKPFDENGQQITYPWPEDTYFGNPLERVLYTNIDESYQLFSNNYIHIDFPFVPGLSNRINAGVRTRLSDYALYMGRDTQVGVESGGSSETSRNRTNNTVFENVLSYNRDIGIHTVFATAVFGYEKNTASMQSVIARNFPNDYLMWYAASQAGFMDPSYSYDETFMISQMLRLNYAYNSRYLLTFTARRDGYSGFGNNSKWGVFPSVAVAWNLHDEPFFPWKGIVSELKPRLSWGLNGNHAVGAYSSISRLGEYNMIAGGNTAPGFVPSRLGQDNLGWESSETLNFGLDFSIFDNRISGEVNVYNTNTTDLLLNRSISSVHGITSIIQNIGETRNRGFELTLQTRNISTSSLTWVTSGNVAYVKNEIIDLYGDKKDDIANEWFIGKPINVIYDYVWEGTWQLDEADEAASWGSQPGFVKLTDVDGDHELTAADRQIIGKTDPSVIWGLTNSVYYKNFGLNVFIHGVHGVTRENSLMDDYTWAEVRINATKKNWWTPENPTNEWIVNHLYAHQMAGIEAGYYEDASFIRVKDVSLSYDLPKTLTSSIGIDRLRLYLTAKNLFTITGFNGLDPELSSQWSNPMQREIGVGINLEF